VWLAFLIIVFVSYRIIKRLFRKKKWDWNSQSTFLVTGAASGIGKKLAETLVARGQNVVAADINWVGLQDAANTWKDSSNGKNILLVQLAITKPAQWEDVYSKAIEKFGGIDGHMNVAGYLKPGFVSEMNDVDVERHIDINVKGLIYGTKVAAQHMIKKKKGFILNIASMAALVPVTGLSLYGASKAAARSFSMATARELRQHGVAVTCLCPDAVRTPMLDLQQQYKEANLTFSAGWLEVEDVISVILDEAILYQPIEIWYPMSRGLLARFGEWTYDLTIARIIEDHLLNKGNKTRSSYVSSTKRD